MRRHGDPLHKRALLPATKKKISEALKGRPLTEEWLSHILAAVYAKPNKSERRLLRYLNEPAVQFRFCGDGSLIIGGKCPDYVYLGREKLLIELFGEHWHQPDEVEKRQAHFAKYGFSTLIVWSKELKDRNTIIAKVAEWRERKAAA